MRRLLTLLFILALVGWGSWAEAETKRIDGTTNVEDTFIREYYPDYNYGGNTLALAVELSALGINPGHALIRVKNVASELGAGATNITAVCSLYCYMEALDSHISAHQVFKPWVEGTQASGTDPPGATWDDWDNDDYEWTTAGCESADDEGEDNSGDGTGADRKATYEDSIALDGASKWYAFSISTELATGWYNGTMAENGIVLIPNGETDVGFHPSEYTSDPTKCPFWTFTYTVAADKYLPIKK